ncbi:MAG: CBS domain-containing protein [Candidatus Omnitrophica bacterium]|nr:CBS domain-containing protein [Candidatus Omnitrophota bacterium]
MKVKDIMTRGVKSLSPHTTIREALNLLLEMHISGLPVINENNKIIGMFTEKDVLRNLLPSYIDKVGNFVYEENPKSIKKKIQDLLNLKVSQVMRKDVLIVDEDTALCEVARIMLTQRTRRLPVVDKDKNIVGIVAREDILKAYIKESSII